MKRRPEFVLVGGGRLARAILARFGTRCYHVPMSTKLFNVLNPPEPFPALPPGSRPLVYCFGPAGEVALRNDIPAAVLATVVFPVLFRERNPSAPFIYISSLLAGTPTWYGALKAMAEFAVQTCGSVSPCTILRLGSVLYPDRQGGVASQFFRDALLGRTAQVPPRDRVISVVGLPTVLDAVRHVVQTPPADWAGTYDIGYPLSLRDLAAAVFSVVRGRAPDVTIDHELPDAPDYQPVRTPLFALPPLRRVLADWARTDERKKKER